MYGKMLRVDVTCRLPTHHPFDLPYFNMLLYKGTKPPKNVVVDVKSQNVYALMHAVATPVWRSCLIFVKILTYERII